MNSKLAKAISLAISGAALTVAADAASAGTTMYNTFNAFATATATDGAPVGGIQPTTDGWVYGFKKAPSEAGAVAPSFVGIGGASAVSASTPFGYAGAAILNWAASLGASDSVTVSQADAFSRYGVYADIDSAQGAWSDTTTPGGWKHNTDLGLFRSDVTTQVNLTIVGVKPDLSLDMANAFGFTIFKGMDTSTAAYSHHGPWNSGNNVSGLSANTLLPGTSFSLSDVVAYSVGGSSPQNINHISFTAEAGQVYSIALGGYKNGQWWVTAEGYQLSITTASAVPVPAAVWLFGSAMAGFGALGRRKRLA